MILGKHMSLFVWAVVMFGVSPVLGATNFGTRAGSSADLTGMPATRERANINYEKYETRTTTRTYDSNDAANIYYTQPAGRSAIYRQYDNVGNGTVTTVRTTRAETVRTEMKRKYYLAHPFYQPLQGKVGSVTDFYYNTTGYDFDITQTWPIENTIGADPWFLDGASGSWKTKTFSIKEDLSYGITDRFAIIGMLRYDASNKYEMPITVYGDTQTATMKDNGLNAYGVGLRWRFVDDADWIATGTAQYQRHNDIINYFALDLQAGYKVARSTIYGLGRVWYGILDDGNSYGDGIVSASAEDGTALTYIPYKENSDSVVFVEGGVGVFSVLDEDWTLNLEGIFGHYDWHQQLSFKAAIGWQPNDWFALNLYGKVAAYDTADGKTKNLWWQEVNADTGVNLPTPTNIGTVKMDGYSDYTVGIQAIFEF